MESVAEPEVQQPEAAPEPQAPPLTKAEKLYNGLLKAGYSADVLGSKDKFIQDVQDPIKANKLYSGLRASGFDEATLGSMTDFRNNLIQKKNPFGNGSPNGAKPSTGGSPTSPASPHKLDLSGLANLPDNDPEHKMYKQLKTIFPNIDKHTPSKSALGLLKDYGLGAVGAFNGKLGDITDALSNITKTVGRYDQTGLLTKSSKLLDWSTNYLHKTEKDNPLPENTAGNIVKGVAKTVPTLLGAYATGGGTLETEAAAETGTYLTNAQIVQQGLKQAVNPITKYMMAENAVLKGGEAAKKSGGKLLPTILGMAQGGQEGFEQGVLLSGSMGLSEDLVGLAKKTGVIGEDNKITQAALKALITTPAAFATADIAQDIAHGNPVDVKKSLIQGYSASPFEIPGIIDAVQNNKVINFMTAKPEDIKRAVNAPESADELQIHALGKGIQAESEPFMDDKNVLHLQQLGLQQDADIKENADAIVKDKKGYIKSVEKSDLPAQQKKSLIHNVHEVSKVDLDAKITELDNAMDNNDQRVATTPSEIADKKVVGDRLQKERDALNNELEKTVGEQYENQAKPIIDEQPPQVDEANQDNLPETPPSDETGKPETGSAPVDEAPKTDIANEPKPEVAEKADDKSEPVVEKNKVDEEKAKDPNFSEKNYDEWEEHRMGLEKQIFHDPLDENLPVSENGKLLNEALKPEFKKIRDIINDDEIANKYISAIQHNPKKAERIRKELPEDVQGLLYNRINEDDFEDNKSQTEQFEHLNSESDRYISDDMKFSWIGKKITSPTEMKKPYNRIIVKDLITQLSDSGYSQKEIINRAMQDRVSRGDNAEHVTELVRSVLQEHGKKPISEQKQLDANPSEPTVKAEDTGTGKPEPDKAVADKAKPIKEDDKLRQKAIDAVVHGLVIPDNLIDNDPSERFDFGSGIDKKKALSDIRKGNYDTAPAKKVIDKIVEWEKNGEYPVMRGTGGGTLRGESISADEIGKQIEDAKTNMVGELTPRQIDEFNQSAKDLGITYDDIKAHEDYEKSRDYADTPRSISEDLQKPEDDQGTGGKQGTGSEAPQVGDEKPIAESKVKGKVIDDGLIQPAKLKGSKYNLVLAETPEGKFGITDKNTGVVVSNLYDTPVDARLAYAKNREKLTPELIDKAIKNRDGAAQSAVMPLPFFNEFIEHDVKPIVQNLASNLKEALDKLVKAIRPQVGVAMKDLDTISTSLNARNETAANLDKLVNSFEKLFDKMKDPQRIDFIDRIKRGIKQPTPELQQIADAYKKMDDELYNQVNGVKGNLTFKENHFRVLWKTIPGSEKAKTWFGRAKRPLEGSKGFLKRATLTDMSEGIKMGGVPESTNPFTMFKLAHADATKFITAHRMFDALKQDGVVKFVKMGDTPPENYTKIDDKIANVYFPVKEGLVKAGEYYVEKNAGRIINNALSEDKLRSTVVGKGILAIKNAYTAIELSLSPYHATAMSLEAASSDVARGVRKLVNLGIRGDFKSAGEGIMDILKAPFSPKSTFTLGRNTIKLATEKDFENSDYGKKFLAANPEAKQYIHDFFMGGGLMKQDDVYKLNAYQALKDNMAKDNYIGAAIRALPALNEAIMSPLFDTYIPGLKVGMFMKEYPLTLAENASRLEKGTVTREALARKTVDFIEDRLGEMNFDNLYWDRTFKTANQLMFRSVTWKLGNARALGGALPEQGMEFYNAMKEGRPPILQPKVAWMLGLAAVHATASSLIQYGFTGTWPQNFKDLMWPRTSKDDPKERVSLPDYGRDISSIYYQGAGNYVKSSLAGDMTKLYDIWNNSDFQKYNIYDPKDPFYKEAEDGIKYAMPQPIGFSQVGKDMKNQTPVQKEALHFIGFSPSPKYITNTPIENKIYDLYNMHEGIKSKGQKNQAELKDKIRTLYTQGKPEEANKLLDQALNNGDLKVTQIKYLIQAKGGGESASSYFFQNLPDDDKVWLYNQMTEAEKEEFDPKGKVGALAAMKNQAQPKKEKPYSSFK